MRSPRFFERPPSATSVLIYLSGGVQTKSVTPKLPYLRETYLPYKHLRSSAKTTFQLLGTFFRAHVMQGTYA